MRLFLGNAIQGFLLQKLLNCFARPPVDTAYSWYCHHCDSYFKYFLIIVLELSA